MLAKDPVVLARFALVEGVPGTTSTPLLENPSHPNHPLLPQPARSELDTAGRSQQLFILQGAIDSQFVNNDSKNTDGPAHGTVDLTVCSA
jgi:hypothetical protein